MKKDLAAKIQELQELGNCQKEMANLIEMLTQENVELRKRIVALEVILEKAEMQLITVGINPNLN